MSSILSQEINFSFSLLFLIQEIEFSFSLLFSWIYHPSYRRENLVSSVVPMDVLHPVAGNQKKILSVIVLMDVIHPVSATFFFPLFMLPMDVIVVHPVAGKFFGLFCSSYGCYPSILLQKPFFPSPLLLFPWMSSILSATKLIYFLVQWDRLFVVPIGCHPFCRTQLSF